jgi:2'-5' RNA ligase
MAKHDYATTHVELPGPLAKEVLSLGSQIDKNDLHIGETPTGLEKKPHITVRYGLGNGDSAKVRGLLKDERPASIQLKGLSLFHQKGYDVLKVDVESEDLRRINGTIKNNTDSADTHPKYNPHVTVAYLKKGTGQKYMDSMSLNKSFVGRGVIFSDTAGREVNIPLGTNTKISEKLAQDVAIAVMNKLAALDEMVKEGARKKRKTKPDYGRFVAQGAGAAGGALMSSIFSDLKTKPIEALKTRLYSMVDSAASTLFPHRGFPPL